MPKYLEEVLLWAGQNNFPTPGSSGVGSDNSSGRGEGSSRGSGDVSNEIPDEPDLEGNDGSSDTGYDDEPSDADQPDSQSGSQSSSSSPSNSGTQDLNAQPSQSNSSQSTTQDSSSSKGKEKSDSTQSDSSSQDSSSTSDSPDSDSSSQSGSSSKEGSGSSDSEGSVGTGKELSGDLNQSTPSESESLVNDVINQLTNNDNEEDNKKRDLLVDGNERGINPDENLSSEDIADISTKGKSLESDTESKLVDDAFDKSQGEAYDYYSQFVGLKPKMRKEGDTVSKLEQILRRCLNTEERFDPNRPRRNIMLDDGKGTRYYVLGSNVDTDVPTTITLVLDRSGSMNVDMFKRSIYAMVQILAKVRMEIRTCHIISFGTTAKHSRINFGGRVGPKAFFNKIASSSEEHIKGMRLGTEIMPAYNLLLQKCKDSDLVLIFSDFWFEDGDSRKPEYTAFKNAFKRFGKRSVYITVPSSDERITDTDIPGYNVLDIHDPTWRKRSCTLAQAAKSYKDIGL